MVCWDDGSHRAYISEVIQQRSVLQHPINIHHCSGKGHQHIYKHQTTGEGQRDRFTVITAKCSTSLCTVFLLKLYNWTRLTEEMLHCPSSQQKLDSPSLIISNSLLHVVMCTVSLKHQSAWPKFESLQYNILQVSS